MTPDDDDLTPDPQTAADDAADDAHTERWQEAKARGWEAVEHDAMCPARCDFADYAKGRPDTMCRGGDCTRCDEVDCLCDGPDSLIARVRADERERAAGRVQSLYGPRTTPAADTPAPKLDAALSAIREGGA